MRSRLLVLISATLATAAIAALVVCSHVFASGESDKAEIVALNRQLVDSFSKRDVQGVMSCYMDAGDEVFFEDDFRDPLHGKSALYKYIREGIESTSQIQAGMETISVVVSGDLAAAHYIMPFSETDKAGKHSKRGRETQVLRKVNGKWLIWHEHFSVPYDPATGKAFVDTKQ